MRRRPRAASVALNQLAHGTIYRLEGVYHFWNGKSWSGMAGVRAGLYVGVEPFTGRRLFNDTDDTYGVTDTYPVTAKVYKVKYVGL